MFNNFEDKEGKFTVCRRCNKEILIPDAKYDQNSKKYICKECYSLKDFNKNLISKKESSIKKSSSGTGYFCTVCRYKFKKYNLNTKDKRCPSCSREGTVEKIKTADEILKDSEFF